MFCPKCGTQVNDDAVFCSKCGINLNDLTANQPNALIDSNLNVTEVKSVKSTKIVIIISSVIIIILCIIGLIAYITNLNNSQNALSDIPNNSKVDVYDTSSRNNNIKADTLSGVYSKMGWYDYFGDYHNNTVVFYRFCVEFFDDRTAIWWEDTSIYGNPIYYVCSYIYNDENDSFTLYFPFEEQKTLTITINGEYLVFNGNYFNNDVFKKGNYNDITEAVEVMKESYISESDYRLLNE